MELIEICRIEASLSYPVLLRPNIDQNRTRHSRAAVERIGGYSFHPPSQLSYYANVGM